MVQVEIRSEKRGNHVGTLLRWNFPSLDPVQPVVDRGLGQNDGRRLMTIIYIVSGLVTFGILIYLIIALLKPEIF